MADKVEKQDALDAQDDENNPTPPVEEVTEPVEEVTEQKKPKPRRKKKAAKVPTKCETISDMLHIAMPHVPERIRNAIEKELSLVQVKELEDIEFTNLYLHRLSSAVNSVTHNEARTIAGLAHSEPTKETGPTIVAGHDLSNVYSDISEKFAQRLRHGLSHGNIRSSGELRERHVVPLIEQAVKYAIAGEHEDGGIDGNRLFAIIKGV